MFSRFSRTATCDRRTDGPWGWRAVPDVAMPPKQDRATSMGNIQRKRGAVRTSGFREMLADRQTETHRHARRNISHKARAATKDLVCGNSAECLSSPRSGSARVLRTAPYGHVPAIARYMTYTGTGDRPYAGVWLASEECGRPFVTTSYRTEPCELSERAGRPAGPYWRCSERFIRRPSPRRRRRVRTC